ncbi:hypothetical protein HHJ84_11090 [Photorhabdus heterorhabditis subsp. aluminescens]|nr:hypothetical protein [Photorhabdus heterorhabditis subsp. aluminescens]
MQGRGYFFVLYDAKGNEIWKPSPFEHFSDVAFYNRFEFPTDDGMFLYPTDHGYKGVKIK